ncbi:MAG: recombination-associated protein RdgC [Proteobacteria bacterium]|nr:recombination-associated protein RdgC [Pseudomonadota bacterium]
MWFKNARLFQLTEGFNLEVEQFADLLKNSALKPCGSMEMESTGWISPFGSDSELFVLKSGDALLFALGTEEKVLPAAVVNHQLSGRIDSIRQETGNKPGRKQQSDMKQQVLLEMLPQAFIKPKRVNAYLDLKLNLLVVDSASQNAAENLVSQLRQTLGSFKVSAFGSSSSMAQVLTAWVVKSQAEQGFVLDSDIVLETLDETKGVVRGKNIEHLDDQMQSHIDNGYLVTQLGLSFNDRIEIILGNDMGIKRIRFTDIVLDQMDDEVIESESQLLDSKFTLLSLELRVLFQALFEIFSNNFTND